MRLKDEIVVVIGGGSGIGFAVARMARDLGASIVIGGRSEDRLRAAADQLGPTTRIFAVDTADKASIAAFFDQVGSFHHLLVTAASYDVVAIDNPDDDAAESPFRSKFWGQYRAVRAALPHISPEGSITLMAGAAGARPLKGGSAYAACNSAIEGLGRALAIELAPLRVNTISPGTIDGSLWQNRPAEIREAAFAQWHDLALLGRPGREEEVAEAVLLLMTNRFMTGSTLYPDGGYALR